MPTVTVDPSVEACRALVNRLNTGGAFALDVVATYTEQIIDPLEEIDELRIDVATVESETLSETLAVEDRTSHDIRVWIRAKGNDFTNDTIDPLKLVARQVFQRLNNFDNSTKRVRVWECANENQEAPVKAALRNAGLFVTSILLRVEVEAA